MIEGVSRRTFGGSSGTYNVRALELAAARDHMYKSIDVTVMFIDDNKYTFRLPKRANGQQLLEMVFDHMELVEKDYFGLQFYENESVAHHRMECMRWLDGKKSLKKQLRDCPEKRLYLRVKFYVNDPSKLQHEYTRYQFYLQVRHDILESRLILPPSTACLLASYIVQTELGDYQADEHIEGYLSNQKLIPNQTKDLESKICELHKLHKGQSPADAEFNFLDHAKRVEMYGVELHQAKDNIGKDISLGVTSSGLVVFQNAVKLNTFSWSKIIKICFKRKRFFIQLRRDLSENYDTVLGFNMETYRSCKTLWKACVEHHTFFRLHSPKAPRRFPLCLGSKFSFSGRTEFQTVEDVKRTKLEKKFVRSPSKTFVKSPPAPALEEKGKVLAAPARPPRPYDNKVTSLGAKEPRKAWTEASVEQLSDDEGGFVERTIEDALSPGLAGRVLSYADEEPPSPTSNGVYDTPPYSGSHSPVSQAALDDREGAVTVILFPDEMAKYGFTLKGGTTRDVPIVVSRVALNTPADKSNPRLTEGDQLMMINSQDIHQALHSEVVAIIHEARSLNDGKLVLVVKPNVLYGVLDEDFEEPPYQYVPADEILGAPSMSNALEQSILLLDDGLANGALLSQYELLFRTHPEMKCDAAYLAKNVNKNRYRDISPYDETRVVLENAPSGDYINANFVNMAISGTEIVNHYIATQGPLQSTSEDFWQMVLEQRCATIVMLTTIIERGRAKCFKYWPNLNETLVYANTTIGCISETIDDWGSYVFREFTITDNQTQETQKIRHMQYVAWPDHGVPDSPERFLNFTVEVRKARDETSDRGPLIVHCSAGIGRTGVLVLMETAMCLMEACQPVYPLSIVRTMREQRAMMIQNSSQYKFVCECVHSAYKQQFAS